MRNPVIVFPFLVERFAPASAHAGSSAILPFDPRRVSADVLSRTRRCPPPVEDDSAETLFHLAWVLIFTLTSWHFW